MAGRLPVNSIIFLNSRFLLLFVLLLFAGSACVTTSQGRKMQSEIVELQAQFSELRSEKERLKETIAAAEAQNRRLEDLITETTQVLRRNNADFGVQIEELRLELQSLRGELEKVNHDFAVYQEDERIFREDVQLRLGISPAQPSSNMANTAAGQGGAVVRVGSLPALPSDKAGLYAYAYEKYQAGELMEARRAFETYAQRFPKDKRADNAIYFSGEILFRDKKYEDAIVALQKILTTYANGDKEDDALLKIGECFLALGKCSDAKLFFGELIRKHPKSALVKKAKELNGNQHCK